MSVHAVLSPSAAHRWINCPGSVRANATHERKASHYAEEGTAAHALLEMCLRLGQHPEEFEGTTIHQHTGDDGNTVDHVVDEDMINAVGHAYDYIVAWQAQHPKGQVYIERTVHWGAALGLSTEQASGTADVMLYDPTQHVLEVMDYKHGAGKVVEVDDNDQIMLYAIGALNEFAATGSGANPRAGMRNEDAVETIIVQPRARHEDGPLRSLPVGVKGLKVWLKNTVAPAAKLALKANAPRKAGDWCRWCSAAPTCRALVDHVMEQAGTEFGALVQPTDPTTLNDDELAQAMAATDLMEAWIHAVRGRVLDHLLAGRAVPGWKLVQGRSTREWNQEELAAIVATVAGVFEDPRQYAPRVLRSVAQMEKLFRQHKMGKDFVPLLGDYVQRSTPGIHTAPEHDPRPAYTRGSEFGDLDPPAV